jgi:hypothetical protein
MRIPTVIARASLCAIGILLVNGCNAMSPLFQPAAAAFEARCARLPPGSLDVVATPIVIRTDDTRSSAELTARNKNPSARHRTLGLTEARIGHRAAVAVNGLQNAQRERGCFQVSVHIELFMEPMTVFIASEFRDDPCRHAAVLSHEMKHVAVYNAYLADAQRNLTHALPQVVDRGLIRAVDATVTQQEVQRALDPFLDRFLQQNSDEVMTRQSAVDSAEEYARVDAACLEPRRT